MTETPRDSLEIFPSPEKKGHWVIEARQWLNAPLEEVFPFFADASNLSEITPPWLKFTVLTEMPVEMKVGLLLDYKLRLRGIPIRWRTEIAEWDPPHSFVDLQLKGPYRLWHHRHSFRPEDDGTWVEDTITYRPTGGWLANKLLVENDLKRVFQYRQDILLKRFAKKETSCE